MDEILKIYERLSLEIFKLNSRLYEHDIDKINEYLEELGKALEDLAIELNEGE